MGGSVVGVGRRRRGRGRTIFAQIVEVMGRSAASLGHDGGLGRLLSKRVTRPLQREVHVRPAECSLLAERLCAARAGGNG